MAAMVRWIPMLVAAGLAAACSSQSGGSGPTPMGHTYVSTKVEHSTIPGGGPLILTFADGRVSANAGCNTSSGPVTFDGNTLHVSGMATTMMGCPGERSGADAWQTGLLQNNLTWKLTGGTLTLTGTNIVLTLMDKKLAQPDLPLTGTPWVVNTLLRPEGQVRSQALDQVRPTLTIAPDGQVSGLAGCNRITGRADISATEITFHIGTTRMLCAPEVMDIEGQVLEALHGNTEFSIDSGTLTIRNAGNNTGLVLNAEN